jgi:Flp pilus assembly protein TadB
MPAPRQHDDPGAGFAVPRMSRQVAEYERTADSGGWHDEVGCLVLAAGGIGWVAMYSKTLAVAPGAIIFALATVVAVTVWLNGHRQGRHKQALREEARAYARDLKRAQDAGAVTPELSPPLQALLDDPQ